jgi:hypothetical protein
MRLKQRAAQLTLLPEARLASPPAWQDDGREVLTCDGSGLSFSACAARLVPAGSWQRTLSESLASSLTGSTGCAVSLRLRATKCGRSLLVPTTSGPHTGGTGSGSSPDWPTASAGGFEMQDAERLLARREECKARNKNGNGFGLTLNQATKLEALGLWATPNTMDGGQTSRGGKRKGMRPSRAATGRKTGYLCEQVGPAGLLAPGSRSTPTSHRGSLNPAWVSALMGFPTGWLAASPPVTAGRRSRRSGTASCPSVQP